MLRGINKQIIEIKCPNNECFEKILLFVKSEKTDLSKGIIQSYARSYYDAVMNSYGKVPLLKQRRFRIAVTACALLGAVMGIIAVMFFI
ncbi:MAG: hypothetical protein K2F81_05325 [Ruminococcus sp.]|nr:hypothetical protein [Ruminococcus sp.]